MALNFQQTDTAKVCADGQYCRTPANNAAKVVGTGTQATTGGATGTGTISVTYNKSSVDANPQRGPYWEIIVPNGAGWASGTWTFNLKVNTGDANITLNDIYICRVNSSCVSQGTVVSFTSLATTMSPGTYNFTGTGVAVGTPASGDKMIAVLSCTNAETHGDNIIVYATDQVINSPFTTPTGPSTFPFYFNMMRS